MEIVETISLLVLEGGYSESAPNAGDKTSRSNLTIYVVGIGQSGMIKYDGSHDS